MRVPDALVGGFFEPAWDVYERSVRLRTLRELRRSQWGTPDQVRARQEQQLRVMLDHARATCPFYRDTWAAAGIDAAAIRSLADLARLPIVTKDDIRQRQDEFIAYINGNVATFGEFAELSPRDFHGPLKRDGDLLALRDFEALFLKK